MNRSAATSPLARTVTVACVGALALTLSGCVYSAIPADEAPRPSSSAPQETAEPEGAESGVPSALTFDAGTALPASAYIEWGDSLMADDGWEITSPDDGNGSWTHGTVDGTCTAQFWQGFTGDVDTVPGDDSASSDAILATLLQTDPATVTAHASDGTFSYQVGGNADVDHRRLASGQDDRNWIMAARAFTATGIGVYLLLDCTGGDVEAVFAEVVDKNPIIAY
ncbi:hypothetical protein HD600_001038 [Microbacterium ginsengiterrae]|uniref:PknH-like protein n=1 Tax=Microbacterium ginsengiterrae TaxID=546115 RepID=A0A7W9FAS3_9MICO|nr:hypothetical protein [Microbacterium ginsengiterrae]MBB5742541.1 hypothetical protein [Microbacterium ginsengiterrae]